MKPPSPLLNILRDIYVRSVVPLAYRKLRKHIEKICFGCREPECAMNQMAHDICMMMEWDDQLIVYLPDILEEITTKEIGKVVVKELRNYQPKDLLKEMLVSNSFCVATFLYICEIDMRTDMRFQTHIAQTIFKQFGCTDEKQNLAFERRYLQSRVDL